MNEKTPDQNIEAIYPLSPMQQGMLFHILHTPELGMYFTQWTCVLSLDLPAFLRAWQRVIDHYDVLRTAFVWQGLDEPVQVVGLKAKLRSQQYDWRTLSPAQQEAEMEMVLEADRRRGFNLAHAPLLRLTFIRLSDQQYWFLLSLSHLLLDGWSLNLILEEVFALYQDQQKPVLPGRPYRDYIAWLQQQDPCKAEAFWRRTLKNFRMPVPLPTAEITGLSPEGSGEHRQQIRFSSATTLALQALASRNQLTFNTLIQGAWAFLLSRYSGEEDIVFGVVVSGRPAMLAHVESMVGLFINTLPCRVHADASTPLLTWLRQIQNQQLEAREYAYSSLAQIQTWSEILHGQALFQSIVNFENYAPVDSERKQETGLRISQHRFIDRSNYPLTLVVIPGNQLILQLLYDRSMFAQKTILRLLSHMQTVLEGFIAAPEAQLSAYSILTAAEQQQALWRWNRPGEEPAAQQWVPDLFEHQARSTPDAVALIFQEQHLSYQELAYRARSLAVHLQRMGVGPEVVVGLCVERSPHWLIGLLAILLAGGAYLPLDPTSPAGRLEFLLRDSSPAMILTTQELLPLFAHRALPHLCLDQDPLHPQPPLPALLTRSRAPASLAYIIYTSGSTGLPKATLLTQQGLANLALNQAPRLPVAPEDRVLQFAPASFDASLSEVVMALLWGATLYLPSPRTLLAGTSLLTLLEEQAITTVTLPPSVLASLPQDVPLLSQLRHLRHVLIAGEAWSGSLLDHWPEERQFFNAYGPTEGSVCATMGLWSRGEERPTLGPPLAHTRLYLLDRWMHPVPPGVVGELYLGGAGLARGYWQQPALTAERFVPDPFSREAGARLYRTGDLGCMREGGEVEYRGRKDRQVKVRGYRIELEEIEHVLKQQPGVREAVVLQETVEEQSRLVAYVQGQVEAEELRENIKQWLPAYLLPNAYVVGESLPLLSNGKVDRRALPRWAESRPQEREGEQKAWTPLEKQLEEIWCEVLGVKRIGRQENFFEIGGHSLLAVRALSRIRAAFLVDLLLDGFFAEPTIAGLATVIEQLSQQEQQKRAKAARLLQNLEQLSDEEVTSRLSKERTDQKIVTEQPYE